MASDPVIGELLQKNIGITVEWTIKNILSYTKVDDFFHSPSFFAPGSQWRIRIYPNGAVSEGTIGVISVFLFRDDNSTYPYNVVFTFAAKGITGPSEKSFLFKEKGAYSGFHRFMDRKRFPTTTGDLTVICTVKVNESFQYISRLIKLSENLKDLFISEKGCDVTLKVNQQELPAHKSILIARSPVLAAMFDADMKEKNTGTVDILDCHPEAFKDFLEYTVGQ